MSLPNKKKIGILLVVLSAVVLVSIAEADSFKKDIDRDFAKTESVAKPLVEQDSPVGESPISVDIPENGAPGGAVTVRPPVALTVPD